MHMYSIVYTTCDGKWRVHNTQNSRQPRICSHSLLHLIHAPALKKINLDFDPHFVHYSYSQTHIAQKMRVPPIINRRRRRRRCLCHPSRAVVFVPSPPPQKKHSRKFMSSINRYMPSSLFFISRARPETAQSALGFAYKRRTRARSLAYGC